ncbi:STM3941 family protein [Danxiaibacter flavus]|uniref:STM3941 family protein n=1 Tax=Danxiaibacter flavus TaxID=3049108 RepID=UPI0034E061FE
MYFLARVILRNTRARKKLPDNLRMTNSQLEVRTSRSFSLFVVVVTTALVSIFAYSEGNKLFDWTRFNPNGINAIIFLLFLFVCLFWWIKLLDKKPQIIINDEGIRTRKNVLPFSPLRLIPWEDISYFYLLEKTQRNVTGLYLGCKKKRK